MKKIIYTLLLASTTLLSCTEKDNPNDVSEKQPFRWEAANLYFLLVDRFHNGDTSNDVQFERTKQTGVYRGFEGGDLRGIIQKIDGNYFTELGINAIWLSPIVEQIKDGTDEGTGFTYGYHGYWTRDWTRIDPNFGTEEDLKELIEKAHSKGIRIVLDAVINHTGPVTPMDSVFPNDWVRTEPACKYDNYINTIECTLVKNLPDILTESEKEVEIPEFLKEKWKAENRYEEEMASLNKFFKEKGYPRTPKYYIIKWLSDYIVKYGIDGYRVDTVKHTEENVWYDFDKVCQKAFETYKNQNPSKVLDDQKFFLVGEVYGYNIHEKQMYRFSDREVNYFDNGFQSLINFAFRTDATQDYETLFNTYNSILQKDLAGKSVMNYISSHDDGAPFDPDRKKNKESATKLLLTPGISQVYYGDEIGRLLIVEGAIGDANLRSPMNWKSLTIDSIAQLHTHWQKIGKFRAKHPSIGIGVHQKIADAPYTFSRIWKEGTHDDRVIIALDLKPGHNIISTANLFKDGTVLRDGYSGKTTIVKNNQVEIDTPFDIVLLENL